MLKWIYGRNNGYDYVAKVIGSISMVITQADDFPCLVGLDSNEQISVIDEYMDGVIEYDYSSEWEKHNTNDIFPNSEILWEQDIDISINALTDMSDDMILAFVDGADAWDEYGVIECTEYLCRKYEIPMVCEDGSYRDSDEIMSYLKKLIL